MYILIRDLCLSLPPQNVAAPDPVLFDEDLVASHGRMLDAGCDDDCDLDCAVAVPHDRRLDAYREYHDATSAATDRGETRVAQNAYLCGCVELRERTVDTDDHIIEQTPEFWLGGDGIKVGLLILNIMTS